VNTLLKAVAQLEATTWHSHRELAAVNVFLSFVFAEFLSILPYHWQAKFACISMQVSSSFHAYR
jgi:hypothetical protein